MASGLTEQLGLEEDRAIQIKRQADSKLGTRADDLESQQEQSWTLRDEFKYRPVTDSSSRNTPKHRNE